MTLDETHSPEKVRRGAWLIVLIAVVSLAVFFADEVLQELSEGPTLWISADQTRALARGAPVWLAGHRVGRVTRVVLRPATAAPDRRVLVRTVIRADEADRFRADATATFQPAGLMQPTVVSVRPGSPGAPPLDFSDTLEAGPAVTSAELRAGAERARAALDSLRRAERRVLALADTGGGTLARLRDDGALRARLPRLRDRLARAAALLRSDSSDLARFRGDPEAVERMRSALGRAESLAPRLEEGLGRWTGLASELASVRSRADTLRRALAEAEGTAGRLLHDRALERELGNLRTRILSLQAELLEDPFRWLRFRLFRGF